jgi:predicted CoA-substrate-specific enzyme activase
MFAGVDIGSASTKAVLMSDSGILSYHILGSGSDFRKSSQEALNEAIKKIGATVSDIDRIITTGYGRYITQVGSEAVTEISCGARGVSFLCPEARTIVDIGGQDTKAIRISDTGQVLNFAMNDKCAAGTGRFLERIAFSLGLDLDKMAALSLKSSTIAAISSTCTVFAETEVVSRISRGEPLEGIVRGLHNALAGRIYGLVLRVGIEGTALACGGGALNAGLVRELRDFVGDIALPPSGLDPRLLPAVGAALIARERYISHVS